MSDPLQWLKEDLDSFKAEMKSDMKEIKDIVVELQKAHWKTIGGFVVVSAIFGIGVQLLIALIQR